jgi:prevent-host-death family protein
MVETIQSTDLRRRVRDVLDRVRIKREPVIVQNYGTPQAVIVPYEDFEAYREWQSGRAERQEWLAELRAIAEDVSNHADAVETEVQGTQHTTADSGVENGLRPEYDLPQLLRDGMRGRYAAENQKTFNSEMNESVIPTMIEQMLVLPADAQRKVLEFLQTLRTTMQRGTPGKQLLQFAGLVQSDELVLMQQAIESDCERVDANEW